MNDIPMYIRGWIDSLKLERVNVDSVREEIVIFDKVRSDDEPVLLTDTQIEASFYHELIHCFQWHIKGQTDEWEAQSYSGLLIEFLMSSLGNE